MATNPLEFQKNELTLGINSFDNPAELANAQAWAQLMLNLIFLNPGTYPSQPDMGVGIGNYEYDFLDDVVIELNAKIRSQQQQYLPNIPLDAVMVSTTVYNGTRLLIIKMSFTENSQTVNSVVAVNASYGRNFLNFEISFN